MKNKIKKLICLFKNHIWKIGHTDTYFICQRCGQVQGSIVDYVEGKMIHAREVIQKEADDFFLKY